MPFPSKTQTQMHDVSKPYVYFLWITSFNLEGWGLFDQHHLENHLVPAKSPKSLSGIFKSEWINEFNSQNNSI